MAEFVRERYGDEAFLALYRAYSEVPLDVVERHWPMFDFPARSSWDAIAPGVHAGLPAAAPRAGSSGLRGGVPEVVEGQALSGG
jgi:hypothetical protein